MKEKEIVYSGVGVNLLAILITIPLCVGLVLLYKIFYPIQDLSFVGHFMETIFHKPSLTIVVYLLTIPLGIIIHELLHGFAFARYANNGFGSVSFGFNLKAFALYAHCKVPLIKSQYIFAAILPGIVLGVVPLIISLFFGSILWYSWSMLFLISALGDILIVVRLINIPKESLISDHPSKIGCIIKLSEE